MSEQVCVRLGAPVPLDDDDASLLVMARDADKHRASQRTFNCWVVLSGVLNSNGGSGSHTQRSFYVQCVTSPDAVTASAERVSLNLAYCCLVDWRNHDHRPVAHQLRPLASASCSRYIIHGEHKFHQFTAVWSLQDWSVTRPLRLSLIQQISAGWRSIIPLPPEYDCFFINPTTGQEENQCIIKWSCLPTSASRAHKQTRHKAGV